MKVSKNHVVNYINELIKDIFDQDYYFTSIDEEEIDFSGSIENQLEKYLDNEFEEAVNNEHFTITYFHKAMEFLTEEDNSLQESLQLACLYGYEIQDVNSEILASILNEQRYRDKYPSKLSEFLDNLTEYLEDKDIVEEEEEIK